MKTKLLLVLILLVATNKSVNAQHKRIQKFEAIEKLFSEKKSGNRITTIPGNLLLQKNEFTNASVSLLDSMYFWEWDTLTNNWNPVGKILATYDANNNLIIVLLQSWNGSSWVNLIQQFNTYDANNNLLSEQLQLWNGSSWENADQYFYTYDANNNNIVFLYQTWNGSSWENDYRDLYTYDASNNLTVDSNQNWAGIWLDFYQEFFTYDINNNMLSYLHNTDLEYLYTYDANNNRLSELYHTWNGTSWDNEHQILYTYDVNNNLTVEMKQNWNSGSWLNYSHQLYTYNVNNNLTISRYQYWNGSNWVNYDRSLYTYDANNNNISEVIQGWNTGSWLNQDSIHSYYSTVTGIVSVNPGINETVIFPNPFSVLATLELNSKFISENTECKIYDAMGKMVSTYKIKNRETTISRGNLSQGIYFYYVVNENNIISKGKLIIQQSF
ncbi:MAG: T9SS type A sorting domain-containing protein [Bacteroidia bacterium]